MKEEILINLAAVINALNEIHVSGKHDLANLCGSLDVLEKTCDALKDADIAPKADGDEKKS